MGPSPLRPRLGFTLKPLPVTGSVWLEGPTGPPQECRSKLVLSPVSPSPLLRSFRTSFLCDCSLPYCSSAGQGFAVGGRGRCSQVNCSWILRAVNFLGAGFWGYDSSSVELLTLLGTLSRVSISSTVARLL